MIGKYHPPSGNNYVAGAIVLFAAMIIVSIVLHSCGGSFK